MNRVFVSYSRRDKNFAERLARDLSDAGLDVWIDFRQIHAGEMWQDEIFRGLQRAEMVIVCLSPAAVASQWVQREVNTARDQGKLIIPVMAVESLNEVKASEGFNWLQAVHFIRFPERYEQAFRELLDALPGKRGASAFDDIDPANIPNPFKGLEAFQQTDFRFFFGREELIRKALNIVGALNDPQRFLAVVGASGSGKSSLVRAGIIPQIRSGKLPKSDTWRVAIFTPGTDPVEALAMRLSPLLGENYTAEGIAENLFKDVDTLSAYADLILQDAPAESRLLLVVDQFEEVFTRAGDASREQFMKLIHDAALQEGGRIHVIITMRADFFDRLGRYPDIAELFEQENLIIVTDMTAANLLRSIEGPAKAVGLVYEDGLVDRILEDVRRQPGSLPLLQYALKALYDRRSERKLTHAAYDEIGGVERALAKHAETVFMSLTIPQQDIMRRVLLRLVDVSESGDATRRRVQREELTFQGVTLESVQEILDLMTAAESRLLIASREIRASEDVQSAPVTWFEVSHEALIREWERYKDWIGDNLDDLRYGSEVLKAATDWQMANRDVAYLLTGNRLLRAELWLPNADANPLQREFIRVSMEENVKREAARQEQAARELTLQKQAADRLRLFVIVLVISLIGAIGLTGFAFTERQRAEQNALEADENARIADENAKKAEESAAEAAENARIAEQSADESRSFALAASGERALLDGDNELAVALVVEAALVTDNPPPQARLALSSVAYAPGTRRVLNESNNAAINAVTYLPGGLFAISAAGASTNDGSLMMWDLTTGEIVREYKGHKRRVTAIGINPAGTVMLSGSDDGEMILWDIATGTARVRLLQDGVINAITFSPDGSKILTCSSNGTIALWDANMGDLLRDLVGHADNVTAVAFNPADPSIVVSGGLDNTIRLWDVDSGRVIARINTENGVLSLAVSPDGATVAAGFRLRRTNAINDIYLYRFNDILTKGAMSVATAPKLDTERIALSSNGHTGDVQSVVFSPDGLWLASGGGKDDGQIILWEMTTHQPVLILVGHDTSRGVRSLSFNAAGTRLLSSSNDGTMRLWDTVRSEVIRDFTGHSLTQRGVVAVYGVGDRTILSGGQDRTLRLWDTESGLTIQEMRGHTGPITEVDLSADGRVALSASQDGTVRLWDIETGQLIQAVQIGTEKVLHAQFLPGDTRFIAANEAGRLAIWDVATGEVVREFGAVDTGGAGVTAAEAPTETPIPEPTTRSMTAFALSADGTMVVTGGEDAKISIWNIATGTLTREIEMETTVIRSVAIKADNSFVAAGGQNGDLFMWTMKGTRVKSFKGHDRPVIGLEFSPDGLSLLSGATDFTLRLWDIATGFEVRRYTLDGSTLLNIQSLKFSDTGTTILTGLNDSTVRLWRMLPSISDLLVWTFQNRYVPALTCDQRSQFRLDLCDIKGNPPETTTFEVPPVVARPPSLLQLRTGIEVYVNSTGKENTTDAGTVFLRTSPDNTNLDNVIIKLADGIVVALIEGPITSPTNALAWWKVRTPEGQEGFVAAAVPDEGLQLLVPVSVFQQYTIGRYAD